MLIEPPFIFAFHTLRYLDPKYVCRVKGRTSFQEDLGVQVLAMQRPFRLEMPVLEMETLPPNGKSELSDCPSICLQNVEHVTITAKCRFPVASAGPMRVHVRSSVDGLNYGAEDLSILDEKPKQGKTVIGRMELKSTVKFIKMVIENLDGQAPCEKINVTVLLSG